MFKCCCNTQFAQTVIILIVLLLSSGTGASTIPNVCQSVDRSVENFLNSKNQSSLIIFDYLINFGASLREGSIGGGWGESVKGDCRGEKIDN